MMRWCECGERVSVPSLTSVCPDCQESKRVERATSDTPITIVMSSLVPPERKTIADMIEEASTPGLDAGEALAQQAAQWEAKLAIERGTAVQMLAASAKCEEVATKARASAVEARAVGGPVAETAALHLEAVARSLSDLAVAAGVTALAAFVTEGE